MTILEAVKESALMMSEDKGLRSYYTYSEFKVLAQAYCVASVRELAKKDGEIGFYEKLWERMTTCDGCNREEYDYCMCDERFKMLDFNKEGERKTQEQMDELRFFYQLDDGVFNSDDMFVTYTDVNDAMAKYDELSTTFTMVTPSDLKYGKTQFSISDRLLLMSVKSVPTRSHKAFKYMNNVSLLYKYYLESDIKSMLSADHYVAKGDVDKEAVMAVLKDTLINNMKDMRNVKNYMRLVDAGKIVKK